mmetsp:Transcript_49302/g.110999  ORF Transcript_49302/g.110999 Transcript_49302/m.110999 type:complete len:216 (-) Transcript_49302:172-819(-)
MLLTRTTLGAGAPPVRRVGDHVVGDWGMWKIGAYRPEPQCLAELFVVNRTLPANRSNPTNLCKCSACAGGGPGSECCCERGTADWVCSYIMGRGITAKSLGKLVTCPVCDSPSGALFSRSCCNGSEKEGPQEKMSMVPHVGPLAGMRRMTSPGVASAVACCLALAGVMGAATAFLRLGWHRPGRFLPVPASLCNKHDSLLTITGAELGGLGTTSP